MECVCPSHSLGLIFEGFTILKFGSVDFHGCQRQKLFVYVLHMKATSELLFVLTDL